MAEPVMQEAEELHIQKLDLSHLVTEDEAPVDDLFSERQMRLLVDSLYEYEGMRQVWLRWCDADGNLLLTGQEAAAEKERQLLAERARAELAEQRAAALAAKLAALGIDSEAE